MKLPKRQRGLRERLSILNLLDFCDRVSISLKKEMAGWKLVLEFQKVFSIFSLKVG